MAARKPVLATVMPRTIFQQEIPPAAVVHMDVGSSGTGYSVAVYPERGHEPHVTNHRPGLASAGVGDKNLTAILLELDHGVWNTVDVGIMAKKRFQDLMAADAHNSARFAFFERFKPLLAVSARKGLLGSRSCPHPRNLREARLRCGPHEVPLSLPFIRLLQYIREEAVLKVQDATGNRSLTASNIKWGITVPALWDDEAKKFMRYCAEEAGAGKGLDDVGGLELILEPEAATVAALSTAPAELRAQFVPGVLQAVVDCGGFTVDISITRVEQAEPLLLKEVVASTGSTACGAMRVDEAYLNMLREIVGAPWSKAMDPSTITALETKWLDAKPNVSEVACSAIVAERAALDVTDLIDALEHAYPEEHWSVKFPAMVSAYSALPGKPKLDCGSGRAWKRLLLPKSACVALFKPTVDRIIATVLSVLRDSKVKDIRFITLAGGFANSNYVRRAFQDMVRGIVSKQAIEIALLHAGGEHAMAEWAHMASADMSRVVRPEPTSAGAGAICIESPLPAESKKLLHEYLEAINVAEREKAIRCESRAASNYPEDPTASEHAQTELVSFQEEDPSPDALFDRLGAVLNCTWPLQLHNRGLIIPTEPGQLIIRGATTMGVNPEMYMVGRIMKHTYMTVFRLLYDPLYHDQPWKDDEDRVRVLVPIVVKGQLVARGEEYEMQGSFSAKYLTGATQFYRTERVDIPIPLKFLHAADGSLVSETCPVRPARVGDDGIPEANNLGNIRFDFETKEKRQVYIHILLDRTEIMATVTVPATGEVKRIPMRYD